MELLMKQLTNLNNLQSFIAEDIKKFYQVSANHQAVEIKSEGFFPTLNSLNIKFKLLNERL
jgi:dihydroorotase